MIQQIFRRRGVLPFMVTGLFISHAAEHAAQASEVWCVEDAGDASTRFKPLLVRTGCVSSMVASTKPTSDYDNVYCSESFIVDVTGTRNASFAVGAGWVDPLPSNMKDCVNSHIEVEAYGQLPAGGWQFVGRTAWRGKWSGSTCGFDLAWNAQPIDVSGSPHANIRVAVAAYTSEYRAVAGRILEIKHFKRAKGGVSVCNVP